jgi:hypothetical protein
VMSSAGRLWKLFRDHAERGSGIGLKLFGFIAESMFTIIPESCSGSSRNAVRNHPGIAFIFNRIPHLRLARTSFTAMLINQVPNLHSARKSEKWTNAFMIVSCTMSSASE